MNYQIHIQCPECAGTGQSEDTDHGVDKNGPYVINTSQRCEECDSQGVVYLGEETYDSLQDLLLDYPDYVDI